MPAMSRLSPLTLLSSLLLAALLPSPALSTCAINAWGVTQGAVTSVANSTATAAPNTYAWEWYINQATGTTASNNSVPGGVPSLTYGGIAFPFYNVSSATQWAQCNSSNQWLSWTSETTLNFFNVIVNGQYYTSAGAWATLPPQVQSSNLYTLLTAYNSSTNGLQAGNTTYTATNKASLSLATYLGLSSIGNIGDSASSNSAPSGTSILTSDASNGGAVFATPLVGRSTGCTATGGCVTWSIKLPAGLWNCDSGSMNYAILNDASFYYHCAQPGYFLMQNTVSVRPSPSSSSTGVARPSPTSAPSPGARGDPQFAGLRGQDYQVHGIDGGVYNVISDRYMQLNSQFVFLTGPRPCPIMPSTGHPSIACFAHSGSYLGNLALLTGSGEKVLIQSGSAADGLTSVTYNGEMLRVGDRRPLDFGHGKVGSVLVLSTHEVTLTAGLFELEVENSDAFLNLRSVVVKTSHWKELKEEKAHGLLGQTWQLRKGKSAIEGKVDDYLLESEDLFGTDFVFNRFGVDSQ